MQVWANVLARWRFCIEMVSRHGVFGAFLNQTRFSAEPYWRENILAAKHFGAETLWHQDTLEKIIALDFHIFINWKNTCDVMLKQNKITKLLLHIHDVTYPDITTKIIHAYHINYNSIHSKTKQAPCSRKQWIFAGTARRKNFLAPNHTVTVPKRLKFKTYRRRTGAVQPVSSPISMPWLSPTTRILIHIHALTLTRNSKHPQRFVDSHYPKRPWLQ